MAITIAGLDPGAGLAFMPMLKTFAALGVHGATALACVTAQNTYEVRRAERLDPGLVREQIIAVWDDMGINARKTGILGTRGIIEEAAATVSKLGFPWWWTR